jgi:hypothetical protein
MDRQLVFAGAIPLDTDILKPQQNTMVALGYLMEALVGSTTVFRGLGCVPTAPASMQVQIQPGSMISLQALDPTAFGSIASDTTDLLVKMGINTSSTSFGFTAPTAAGQSQSFLIQASFSETDANPNVLNYYNSANPSQPYSGPGNSGTPQNTTRVQRVSLQVKVGAAATTGSQQVPAVDTGWFGLWVVTLQTGQSAISAASIAQYSGAPFLSNLTSSHHYGTPGNAPKVHLESEVQGTLPYANMAPVRVPRTSDLTIYVDANLGNDRNSGLTSGAALKTLQAAINIVYMNYDWSGYQATISVANGSYTVGAAFAGMPPGHSKPINLIGNAASPSSCQITASNSNGISAGSGATISVNGFQITATGSQGATSGYGVLAGTSSWINVGNVIFGSCGAAQVGAVGGGGVVLTGPLTFTGTSPAAFSASGASIQASGATLNMTSPTYTSAFAVVQLTGVASFGSTVFTGAATGSRYSVQANGVLTTGGAGISYLPGNAAGTTTNGGQYL